MRCGLDKLWIFDSLACYRAHHVYEFVQRFAAFSLCRLYHQRLVEEQRKIDCRGVVAVIEQSLGNVEGCDPGRFVGKSVEHELMFAHLVDRQLIEVAQRFLDVVCVESRQLSGFHQSLASERKDIAQCAELNGKIAERGRYVAERSVGGCQRECAVGILHHAWVGQELFQTGAHAYRTRSRASASVRCGECLVEIYVHYVETHIARTCHAEHRVQVGAVVVEQCAGGMDGFRYFRNMGLENTELVGIGEHHRCHTVVEKCA